MSAKGHVARRFGHIKTDFGFEPLPMCIHKTDKRNGRSTDLCCDGRQIVKGFFRWSVEDIVPA
jgi:hypothetical protein